MRGLLIRIAFLSCCASPAMAASYAFTDLGTLGGSSSHAYDINNVGQVVGWSTAVPFPYGPEVQHAFVHANDRMVDLGTSGQDSIAFGINDRGQIVGGSESPAPEGSGDPYGSGDFNVAIVSSGQMQPLIVGTYSEAWAVNNAGDIVAHINEGYYPVGATLFSNGSVTNLGSFAPSSVPDGSDYAFDINDRGQIVGVAHGLNGSNFAFLYENANLGKIGPDGSIAYGINEKGQVVGGVFHEGAFLYDHGTLTIIRSGSLGQVVANDINENGQIVGTADGRAFIYAAGESVLLDSLLTNAPSGLTLTSAEAINDAGQIVGTARYLDGTERAYLLTPTVPEPASALLVAAGVSIVVALSKRRPGQGRA